MSLWQWIKTEQPLTAAYAIGTVLAGIALEVAMIIGGGR